MGNNYLILFTTLLVNQVRGQCKFTPNQLLGSNGAFTYQDANGNLQLQLSSVVQVGATLTMYCGGEETHTITCKQDKKIFLFEPKLPITCGTKLSTDTVIRYNDRKEDYSDCKKTMYSIGHKIKGQFLKLYDACYDTVKLRAVFTQATVFPHVAHLARPKDILFSHEPVMSAFDANSFSQNYIYTRFVKLYGQSQKFVPLITDVKKEVKTEVKTGINRGHLTDSSSFLFEDQISLTYKVINIVPQFASINGGNWKKISEWLNTLSLNSRLTVRTGAMDTLQLLFKQPNRRNVNKPAYLIDDGKNPVPKWIYKIISSNAPDGTRTPMIAFLSYNNDKMDPEPSKTLCTEIECPLVFDMSVESGKIKCCNAVTFIRELKQIYIDDK
ncbi:uncharacterized protein LOC108048967 [Drosophila rhopaloa]|uniref:Uncharacterized protein LOC108048967 n=1 Tax=Drosophila rhopaloa TaxID=1041015 RepID=A0A6P4FJE4_DRORH|nr:uncharacterized protein LOC108048967 [Drosophila rhopaloa]